MFHDIFPPSSRASYAKPDYARTITQHTPLSPYTMLLRLYFSSCTLVTALRSAKTTSNIHSIEAV